jgi:hypothetical protein
MNGLSINYKEEKKVWDNFVLTSPQRSIFTYTKFLDSLQVNYDLVTCYEKGKIVVGAIFIFSSDGELIDGGTLFGQYQGILLADHTQDSHSQITHDFKLVEYFIGQVTARYKSIFFCQSWRLRDLRPFQWHNYHELAKGQFKIDLRYTGILDLKKYNNFDDYASSVRTNRKREFNKASQKLKLQLSDDSQLLDDLHAKTFERQNLERNNQESVLVKSICKHAIAGGYGQMSIALLDDVPVSAVLFLYDDRSAFYLFGANAPSSRNTGAASYLMMHAIKDAFEKGIQEVDFVGVNSPNRGDFKISFNAEIKPYFHTNFIGTPVNINA